MPRLRYSIATDIAAGCLLLTLFLHGSATAAVLEAVVTTVDGAPLADAAIVAEQLNGEKGAPKAALPATATVDQIDKQFVPFVTVIKTGTAVEFPNHDQIRHQVYSFSPAKKFELPLYAGIPALPMTFDQAGVVTLGCNIHDWMVGYIYVTDSPWFAKTDANGSAKLTALPSGHYHVHIWYPGLDTSPEVHDVELSGEQRTQTEWRLTAKPPSPPRRAPLPGPADYR